MAKKTKSSDKEASEIFVNRRPHWKPEQLVRFWVKCGGYCSICQEYLLEHPYTGDKIKYGELAHIIAHGRGGTRPKDKDVSQEYVSSEENIIVLCPTCHTTIDKKENESKYTEQWLRDCKERHEKKIRLQTLPTFENLRKPLKFVARIGGQDLGVTKEQIREALFPDYFPGSGRPYEITLDLYVDETSESYWQIATNELVGKFNADIKPILKEGDKLAVFAIGPMPLLTLLGSLISDFKGPLVYNLFRHQDNAWAWPNDGDEDFLIKKKGPEKDYNRKALVLSLTSGISDRVDDGNTLIYEIIPLSGPKYQSIRSAKQLGLLSEKIMVALDKLSKQSGDIIHVYMAAPNSAAVTLGMCFMPKANDTLLIYDYIASKGVDIPTLTIPYSKNPEGINK